jgi:rhodanese-related sulfurtransferase
MMNTTQKLLSNNPVFSALTTKQTEHLMSEHVGALAGIDEAFESMNTVKVDTGDEIVRYRENGDRYYMIKEGNAEVWKPDMETDIWSCVARLGPGDVFGEEAILVGGFRNATVRMITPGVLLVLEEDVFNSALRSRLVKEVTPEQAYVMARHEDTEWLDCRFEIEYSEVRIPKAQLIPLSNLRKHTHELDHGKNYLVYCRSGRRSICAAYLLSERGFNAVSVKGGIRDWPYALERGA